MNEKLTYEEWRTRNTKVIMSDELKEELNRFHNIDANKEIEAALRKEYEGYLNSRVRE